MSGTFDLNFGTIDIDLSQGPYFFDLDNIDITLEDSTILGSGTGEVVQATLILNSTTQALILTIDSSDMIDGAFGDIQFTPPSGTIETPSDLVWIFQSGFLDGNGAPNFITTDVTPAPAPAPVPEPSTGTLLVLSLATLLRRKR